MVTVGERTVCPRCDGPLFLGYEPECVLCGYANYHYDAPTDGRTNLLSTATTYVIRYVGDVPALADIQTQIEAQLVKNSIVYAVTCPFCNEPMQLTSMAGKRKERSETRYKCDEGHRISLTPAENSLGLGWK